MNYFDIIILGGGSAGLFASLFLPAEMKVAILDKSDKLGTKLLLSGGERCNVTNIDIDPTRDYIGENIKSLPSVFHAFSNEDMIAFLHEHNIETVVEDRGRVLLKSGKAKQLRDLFIELIEKKGVDIFLQQNIVSVDQTEDAVYRFKITTSDQIFHAKNIIVALGGKSYPQVGATSLGYELAQQFAIPFVAPYPALCGMETIEDVAELAGSPLQGTLTVFYGKKNIYQQPGSLLFTHRGLSGPVVFDASLFVSQALQQGQQDVKIQIDIDAEHTSKKIFRFFPSLTKTQTLSFTLKSLRPREEAKVSGGGISLSNLDKYFQSKKVPGLYFIGEILDITGRSGGYNLQWAWSSAYGCAKGIR